MPTVSGSEGKELFRYVPRKRIPRSELKTHFAEALTTFPADRKRVLVIIPDDTRTLPMPELYETLCASLSLRARALTVLVALGTHPSLTDERLAQHLGPEWKRFEGVEVVQHAWNDSESLANIGMLSADEMDTLSGGLLAEAVPIEVNRLVLESDLVVIVGPVFPHEVVGFSGGHKYLFPGVSGPAMVNQSHWLGALLTNPKTIGRKETPVRRMIERAASRISVPRLCVSLVMDGKRAVGLFAGEVNLTWVDRPYDTILSIAPPMYRELWTAGKCAYKLEPVVADGGRLIIYAPHIASISAAHGELIRRVGYHTRDYFLAQWEQFKDVPRAVLAHSSHVKGIGTYHEEIERPRIEVILASAIPEAVCRAINLVYHDPASTTPSEFVEREDEGILVVPNAGERLFRLSDGSVPDIDNL